MSGLEFVANIKFYFLYASSKCYYLLWLIKPFRVFFIFSSAAVSETLIKSFTCSNDSSYGKHMKKPLCTEGHFVILPVLQHHLWLARMREVILWPDRKNLWYFTILEAQREKIPASWCVLTFSKSFQLLVQAITVWSNFLLLLLWGRSIIWKHYPLGRKKKIVLLGSFSNPAAQLQQVAGPESICRVHHKTCCYPWGMESVLNN